MPKLRELTISAVHTDWTSAAATSFQNLRKLEIRNQIHGAGPTFEQFAALLAASPRLETLNLLGYCPTPNDPLTQTQIPLVHLPVLKYLGFGWSCIDFACNLLVFQISKTLETLSLIDTETGLNVLREDSTGEENLNNEDSSQILDLLADLGSGDSENKVPSRPWISLLRSKSLSMSWVESNPYKLFEFLDNTPAIEEIRLTDVSPGVLYKIAASAETLCPISSGTLGYK